MRKPAKHAGVSSQKVANQEQDSQKLNEKYAQIAPACSEMRAESSRRLEILKKLPVGSKEFQIFVQEHVDKFKALEKKRLDEKIAKSQITDETWKSIEKGRLEYVKREAKHNAALKKLFKENPIHVKSYKSDVQNLKEGESIYVFCFTYAKIQSRYYKEFLGSLTTSGENFSKVYIGRHTVLSRALILSQEREVRAGLGRVEDVLGNHGDVGILLTNKSEDEILSKFREYEEFDFAVAGNTPGETLRYSKDDVLPLPTDISAEQLFPVLRDLGMPVELINDQQAIKMTQDYTVCEEKVRVTANAAKIMKHLNKKMFNYVVLPVCSWTVSSNETEGYHYEYYYGRQPRPSRV